MSLLFALALVPDASAFCGAYVGDAGSTPKNNQSRIAIARDGNRTSLTMFNDVDTDLQSFGLLVPIPVVIDEDNVSLVDRALLERLDSYSAPRLVEYTCEDLYPLDPQDTASSWGISGGGSSSGGCFGGSMQADYAQAGGTPDSASDTAGVTVEEQFDLGEYTAWVLSAEGGAGLTAWLDDNGFTVSAGTEPILQEYIDAESYFLALRVDLDRVPSGQEYLSPLQLRYTSRDWTLPIRLGTTSSAGVQDLLLFFVTPPESGAVAISNYAETPAVEDECMLGAESGAEQEGFSIAEYYDEKLTEAFGFSANPMELSSGQSGFGWTTEYTWDSGTCDPCPSEGPLQYDEVGHLGFDGHYGWHFTRLHLRYTPDAVTQDIALYSTRDTAREQVRFMLHKWELESELPMCGGEEPDNPGTCFSAGWWAARAEGTVTEDVPLGEVDANSDSICAGLFPLLAVPAGIALRRRYRAGKA